MKVKLTKGKEAVIDNLDFDLISKYKWRYGFGGMGGEYAVTGNGKGSPTIRMHRLILGAKKGQIIDHVDGNGLNNMRKNLRIVSSLESSQNKGIYKNNTVGQKGVYLHRGKFEARIMVNDKRIYLGRFDTAKEAGVVYRQAELKYFGEFARKNGGKAK